MITNPKLTQFVHHQLHATQNRFIHHNYILIKLDSASFLLICFILTHIFLARATFCSPACATNVRHFPRMHVPSSLDVHDAKAVVQGKTDNPKFSHIGCKKQKVFLKVQSCHVILQREAFLLDVLLCLFFFSTRQGTFFNERVGLTEFMTTQIA